MKRISLSATIVDLQNNQMVGQQTFMGKISELEIPSCLPTWDFQTDGDSYYVGVLDETEFTTWLYETMAPLGFTP